MPSRVGLTTAPGGSGADGCHLRPAPKSRIRLPDERSMPKRLDPKLSVLPTAQKEMWAKLAPAVELDFVLYGGTAIALHLGHRESLDFNFFPIRAAREESGARRIQ